MKRRRFLAVLAAGAAALATPLGWLAARVLPACVLRARAGKRYPGGVRELEAEAVKRPGRWAG